MRIRLYPSGRSTSTEKTHVGACCAICFLLIGFILVIIGLSPRYGTFLFTIIGIILIVIGITYIVVMAIKGGLEKKKEKTLMKEVEPVKIEKHELTKEEKSKQEEEQPERPQYCQSCGAQMDGRRCSSCRTSWCSNCGSWNPAYAERCRNCHFMLPV